MQDKNSKISSEQQARIEVAVETLAAALRPNQKIGFFFQCVIDSVEAKSNGRVDWLNKQEGRFATGLKHLVNREKELFQPVPQLQIVESAPQPAQLVTGSFGKASKQELKQQVLALLGLQTASQAAKWAKQQGMEVDLCYKAHWAAVLEKAQSLLVVAA